jgi:hypothetical protein
MGRLFGGSPPSQVESAMRLATLIRVVRLSGLIVAAMLASPAAFGQWLPNPYYGWGGFGYGGSYVNTANTNFTQQRIANAEITGAARLARQQSASNMMMQQAQSRTAGILDQRQNYADWWHQTQQRQFAQQPPRASGGPLAAVGPAPVAPVAAQSTSGTAPTGTPSDVIRWPAILTDSRFAAEREQIEAPFRRALSGGPTPTVADYRAIIAASEQMKVKLREMAPELIASEYLALDAFLDQLEGEGRGRIEELEARAKSAGNPVDKPATAGNPKP